MVDQYNFGKGDLDKVTEGTTLKDIEAKLKTLAIGDITKRYAMARSLQKNLENIPKFKAIASDIDRILNLTTDEAKKDELKKLSKGENLQQLLEIGQLAEFTTSLDKVQKVGSEMEYFISIIKATSETPDRKKRDELITNLEKNKEAVFSEWNKVIKESNKLSQAFNLGDLGRDEKVKIDEIRSKGDEISDGFMALRMQLSADKLVDKLQGLKSQVDNYSKGWTHFLKSKVSTLTLGVYGYNKDLKKAKDWIDGSLKSLNEKEPFEKVDKIQDKLEQLGTEGGWRQKFKKIVEPEKEPEEPSRPRI